MVHRRLLTVEFLRNLPAPASGEAWVSDTALQGFGVRVRNARDGVTFTYAIRKSDVNGRSVRRSLNLDQLRRAEYQRHWYFKSEDWDAFYEKDLASFLPQARQWARLEIAKITGRFESDEVLEADRQIQQAYRNQVGAYLSGSTLAACVDAIVGRGKGRGWSEAYTDRLSTAFSSFDRETGCGQLTIHDLSDGRIVDLIKASDIGEGTLRDLRLVLNVVTENIQSMGGPPVGRILPSFEMHGIQTGRYEALAELDLPDLEHLLRTIEQSDCDWRARYSLILAFCFRAHFSRILSGRWSDIKEGRWFPLDETDHKHWWWRWERIEGRAETCLEAARTHAKKEGVESPFWFPAESDPSKPIRNADRAWRHALQSCGVPYVSLGKARNYFGTNYRPLSSSLNWLWEQRPKWNSDLFN